MPLAKCVRCDNLFEKSDNPVCTPCKPDEEADFEKVRECLNEHPDLSAEAVAELADVPLKVVMRMVDQGAVTKVSAIDGTPKCGRCGADAISFSKKLCHSCLEELKQRVLKQKHEISLGKKKLVEVGRSSRTHQMLEQKRR